MNSILSTYIEKLAFTACQSKTTDWSLQCITNSAIDAHDTLAKKIEFIIKRAFAEATTNRQKRVMIIALKAIESTLQKKLLKNQSLTQRIYCYFFGDSEQEEYRCLSVFVHNKCASFKPSLSKGGPQTDLEALCLFFSKFKSTFKCIPAPLNGSDWINQRFVTSLLINSATVRHSQSPTTTLFELMNEVSLGSHILFAADHHRISQFFNTQQSCLPCTVRRSSHYRLEKALQYEGSFHGATLFSYGTIGYSKKKGVALHKKCSAYWKHLSTKEREGYRPLTVLWMQHEAHPIRGLFSLSSWLHFIDFLRYSFAKMVSNRPQISNYSSFFQGGLGDTHPILVRL